MSMPESTPLAGLPNPFAAAVARDAWQPAEADVPAIHAKAFDRCLQAVDYVRRQAASTSVLLYGDPGSGKTHVLARLRSHLLRPEAAVEPQAAFVFVRLQTSGRTIWRHLRRCMVDDLLRAPRAGLAQLETFTLRRLARLYGINDERGWWQWLHEELPNPADRLRELAPALEQLWADERLSLDLRRAIEQRLTGQHPALVAAWLRGEPLEAADRASLGLRAPADDDDDAEERARLFILELCRLAGHDLPIVVCFDQVEALQEHKQDLAGVFAFGQLVAALHDLTNNVLILSCIQSTFMETFKQAIRQSDRDRTASFPLGSVVLEPLSWEQAVRLVSRRLDNQPALATIRSQHGGGLWPLDELELRGVVGSIGTTPRRLLAACADRFEALRGQPIATPPTTDEFLERAWQERLASARDLPIPRTDEILAQGLPLLAHLTLDEWRRLDDPTFRDVDLVFATPNGRVGLSLCNQSMNRLEWRLRRLRDELQSERLQRLLLLRDDRLPISKTAQATRAHLDALAEAGVDLLSIAPTGLAHLAALAGLLADAKAGDLANHGQPIAAEQVEAWLRANLPPALEDLVHAVFQPVGPSGLNRFEPVVSAADA